MNFYFTSQSETNRQNSYNPDVLEGNWYEDRCLSEYDLKKKRDYMLVNPNAWQYDTTYGDLGQNWKDFPSTKKQFAVANDNYIKFSGKDNEMYVTTNKQAFDDRYRETFRDPKRKIAPFFRDMKDYYKNKPEELEAYRKEWTNKEQNFGTTYGTEILGKVQK